MNYNRRKFIQQTAGLTSGFALASIAGNSLFADDFFEERRKLKAFGLQLYTLREDMPKDPKGILKQVASFGYKQIESYEGKDGMFWGMGHTGFKNYMDELGMTIISSHCNTSTDFEKKAAEAAAIGMKYLIYPWEGAGKTLDDYKRFADDFNKNGAVCKKNGIRFAFHNHDYSFKQINGEFPQDVLMKNTDPDLVDFEMDIYWVVAAGEDPKAWFKKHPNRFRLCHVKDLGKIAKGHESVQLGKGTIDFASILKVGKANGLKNFIVEQEAFTGSNPLQSAEADAAYMKALTI